MGKDYKKDYGDYQIGNPAKSGNYSVKNKNDGKIERDDYTTSDGGHWWNISNECGRNTNGEWLYSPSSYRAL